MSKPVVYEPSGARKGYAVVVDREMEQLLERITSALQSAAHPRTVLEYAALSLLDYIETSTDGFGSWSATHRSLSPPVASRA